jgi:hypothetical protein
VTLPEHTLHNNALCYNTVVFDESFSSLLRAALPGHELAFLVFALVTNAVDLLLQSTLSLKEKTLADSIGTAVVVGYYVFYSTIHFCFNPIMFMMG